MRQRDIFRADLPTVLLAKKLGQIMQKIRPALRPIVIGQRIDQLSGLLQALDDTLEHRHHVPDRRRIAASKHDHAGLRQAFTEIVHEVGDTGVSVEMLAKV